MLTRVVTRRMRLDLHLHSTASDGTVAPGEVVRLAVEGGLDVIALTDHDTVAGVAPALDAAWDLDLDVIPAVEMSSTVEGEDVHVLGYFVDISSPAFVRHGERNRARREQRMLAMIERLDSQGYPIGRAQVERERAASAVAFSRPHLARALVRAGHVSSVPEAFDRLIGNQCPAYLPTRVATPEEVLGVILEAGGIPVWAHPPARMLDTVLPRLLKAGLRGLEAYRVARGADRTVLLELARREKLFVTGGSDWHGPAGGARLGSFFVTDRQVEEFLAAAPHRSRWSSAHVN